MANYVVVLIYNEYKSLVAGLNIINQIKEYNQNIIIVDTKLQKQKGDIFKDDWKKNENFKNIQDSVHPKVWEGIPVLPLNHVLPNTKSNS